LSPFADAELVAAIPGHGASRKNELHINRDLLSSCKNSLKELSKLLVEDIMKQGFTKNMAVIVAYSLELGRRRQAEQVPEKSKISGSRDVFEIITAILGDLGHEEFWVIFLNRSNIIMSKEKISQGGIAGTVTVIRIIMKKAFDKLAYSMILVHNHPSGNMKACKADSKITKKLKDADEIMDIAVRYHVIISDASYFSFADEGLM
jgi:DNA repair protein RadC